MDNFRSELKSLKQDRTREQRIAATWQVMAHELLNKKTFKILRYLGPQACFKYLRLCYYVELAVAGEFSADDFPDLENVINKETAPIGGILQTICLINERGSGLPFCKLDCLRTYTQGRPFSGVLGKTSTKVPWCSFCYVCGEAIRVPPQGKCTMHPEGDCPSVDLTGTWYSAALIKSWYKLTKEMPYDEDLYAMHLLQDSNPELTVYEIVILHWNLINPNP